MLLSRWRRRPHRRRKLPVALVGLAAAGSLLTAGCGSAVPVGTGSADGSPAHQGGLVVGTRDGLLMGKDAEGVRQFLGIPYAAPPVGTLRWQPPQPAQPWTGTRNATAYGARCPQLASQDGPRADTENCLFLNVFSPAGGEGRLPVLFWIHGGELVHGAGDLYDGSLIARTDHVIVVSINYRLGAFGFLDVPGLASSPLAASGNYGLLDQEAALRWVRANIAAFGGDPQHVTIAGESAGGWSVCALLAAPTARNLFSGAIMESGSCESRTQSQARAIGLKFAALVGCTSAATAASCLRDMPEETLLDASKGANGNPPALDVGFTSGGLDLPLAPAQAIADGDYAHVPVLLGTNHDEARYFTQGFADDTQQQYDDTMTKLFGAMAPAVLQRYPWNSYPSPYTAAYAIGAIFTDSGYIYGIGGCAEQHLATEFAAGTPTYFYQFDDESAPAQNQYLPGFVWGSAHTQELAYLWPSYDPYGTDLGNLLTPAQLQLSRQLIAWWGAFVRQGTPSAPGTPAWSAYARGQLMSLRPGGQSQPITAAAFAAQHQCSFWDTPRSATRS